MDIANMTPGEKLRTYLKFFRPIVYIRHFDFQAVDALIDEFGRKGMYNKACVIDEYSEAGGRIAFKTKSPKNPATPMPLEEFLARYNTSQYNKDRHNYLLVLKEVHDRISEPRICSLLQTIAYRTKVASEDARLDDDPEKNQYRVQVVIVDTTLKIPVGLEKLTSVIDIRPPDLKKVREIVDEVVESKGLLIKSDFRTELVEALLGLSEFEIRQILALASHNNVLDEDDLTLIHDEKRQMIRKSGLLELIDTKTRGVGGLGKLKAFVSENKEVFKNPGLAKAHGVDAPSGVMIVGMPGCGKSLMAKTIAREFGVPLLKLDVGRLMGKYVGESENNLHRAIAVAEAAAPCVLWIDEIEKAFSGIGDQGGGGSSMTRMFGIFLTWMQEKSACIYVVATANNIDKLPPEFLRRGRFDEIFQVGFPDAEERRLILELHIKERNKTDADDEGVVPDNVDIEKVARKFPDLEHYSGADIESIVKEAMKRVFVNNMRKFGREKQSKWESLTTADLLEVIAETNSTYHSQKDKLDKMMLQLDKLHAKSAS